MIFSYESFWRSLGGAAPHRAGTPFPRLWVPPTQKFFRPLPHLIELATELATVLLLSKRQAQHRRHCNLLSPGPPAWLLTTPSDGAGGANRGEALPTNNYICQHIVGDANAI